jgi:hypothetical protein
MSKPFDLYYVFMFFLLLLLSRQAAFFSCCVTISDTMLTIFGSPATGLQGGPQSGPACPSPPFLV